MRLLSLILMMVLTCGPVIAHELTPTYPKLIPSIYDNIYKTSMNIFNRREDISYYKIEVFDKDWNNLPFATESAVIEVKYLQRKSFDIFIREGDINRAAYICTRSKILKGNNSSVISSNICSKIK